MANKGQQPPYLHLAELTASQFLDIWKHFDADGNGYIEGKELENFFSQLDIARRGAGVDPSNAAFKEKMTEFMQKFDKNKDGRIEMSELAQILPTEENFLLCFRQFVGSSTEFMAVSDDATFSLHINHNHFYFFLLILRLLPVQENFLLKFQGVRLTAEQFNAIFAYYDKDGNGYIDEQELDALLKDLYEKNNKHRTMTDKESNPSNCDCQSIMALSDGGKLYRTELEIVLCREPML
uniref:Calbindin 2a n=1 Tax=Cyprinus carpio TaxID=7962 RepID=A0A8C1MZB0_CYPCA